MADEDAGVAEAIIRSVSESSHDDEELNRAIVESLRHIEDPQLAQALTESRDGFRVQQARILAEYEKARNRTSASFHPAENAPVGASGGTGSCCSVPLPAKSVCVPADNSTGDVDAELAAALRTSMLEPRLSVVEQQAAMLQHFEWEATLKKSANSEVAQEATPRFGRAMTRAERLQLSMDYGGNKDASNPHPQRLARWDGAGPSLPAAAAPSSKRSTKHSYASKSMDTDPALARRSTVSQSSVKKNDVVDGAWLRGERQRQKVVLDGQNVACAHGKGRDKFSSKGLKIALVCYL